MLVSVSYDEAGSCCIRTRSVVKIEIIIFYCQRSTENVQSQVKPSLRDVRLDGIIAESYSKIVHNVNPSTMLLLDLANEL